MHMKLKAQSAMEYLMTYGWAILIVIIVAAALYALGLFNPATFTGQRTTGFPNMGAPSDWIYSANGDFNITLRNGLGEAITISTVTANCAANQGTVTFATDAASNTVGAGSTIEYYVNQSMTFCQTLTTGSSYSTAFTITYTTQSGTYARQDTGTVTGSAS
jgi:hypothetical protein